MKNWHLHRRAKGLVSLCSLPPEGMRSWHLCRTGKTLVSFCLFPLEGVRSWHLCRTGMIGELLSASSWECKEYKAPGGPLATADRGWLAGSLSLFFFLVPPGRCAFAVMVTRPFSVALNATLLCWSVGLIPSRIWYSFSSALVSPLESITRRKRQAHESVGSRLRTPDFASCGGVGTIFSETVGEHYSFLIGFILKLSKL